MKAKKSRQKIFSAVFRTAVMLSAVITAAAALLVLVYILYNGIPGLTLKGMFSWQYDSQNVSMLPAIINTGIMTLLSLAMAVPMGVMAAIYLAEYAKRGNPLINIIRIMAETLAGIPSIVYGFFGLMVIVPVMGEITGTGGKSILTGSVILAVMILPTVINVAESSIRAVPESYYEGSMALGATHEKSVFSAVLPAARSGLTAGVVLGIGRAVGETMAVVMVAGNQTAVPGSLLSGVRTMTANIVLEMGYAGEGLHRDALVATAVVLMVFVLIINLSFSMLKKGDGR